MKRSFNSEELINGIKNNTKLVFDYIERDIKPKAKRMILNNGGNKEDVKEIFQISMKKVFEKIKEKALIDNFENYLLKTCYNLWIDKIKEDQEEKKNKEEYFRINEFKEDEIFLDIMEIYNKLDKGCRDLIQMKADNMSMKEIANELGYTERYIINKKARCKKKYISILNKMKKDER